MAAPTLRRPNLLQLCRWTGAFSSATVMERLVGTVRVALLAVLLICWVAGAYAGIVYWSLEGSPLGVISSAIVPGIAATFTWSAFAVLEKPLRRQR
jgi:hypothetical protein